MQPIVRQLSAAALACSGAYAASINYEQYRKFPSTPTAVRMEQAGQHLREWVVVSDVAYDCNQSFVLEWFNYVSRQHTKSYYVVISDQRGEHQSLVESGAPITCPPKVGHETRGVFIPFAGTIAHQQLIAKGLRIKSTPPGSGVLQLCSACGPGNSLLGLVLFAVAATIGVVWSLREIETVIGRRGV